LVPSRDAVEPHHYLQSTANLVLQDTTERLFAGELYADVKYGVYIVRGENVLLLGEIVRRFP
jgi:U6 snRNA-associated Sm-like protein LSm1